LAPVVAFTSCCWPGRVEQVIAAVRGRCIAAGRTGGLRRETRPGVRSVRRDGGTMENKATESALPADATPVRDSAVPEHRAAGAGRGRHRRPRRRLWRFRWPFAGGRR
jgi:hypothetical protein